MSLRVRGAFVLSILSLALAGASGCVRGAKAPATPAADWINVVAMSEVEKAAPAASPTPQATPGPRFSRIAGKEFKAQASAAYPASAGGAVERLAVARAEARRAALRSLAGQLLEFRSDDGPPLRQRMVDGDGVARLLEFLESKARVDLAESPEGVAATAQASGKDVAAALGLDTSIKGAEPRVKVIPVPEGPDPQKVAEAQERAVSGARDRLYEELLNLDTPSGRLRDLADRDPKLRTDLRALVDAAEPASITFTPEGQCKATIQFDRSRALQLVPGGPRGTP